MFKILQVDKNVSLYVFTVLFGCFVLLITILSTVMTKKSTADIVN